MKKLQNNFTTPEQSNRLLELGVPAKSADCFWSNPVGSKMYASPIVRNKLSYRCKDWFKKNNYFYTPCWSVGRLIEIYLTCALEYHPYDDFYTETPSLHLMAFDKDRLIEEVIEIMSEDKMDFSKLED